MDKRRDDEKEAASATSFSFCLLEFELLEKTLHRIH